MNNLSLGASVISLLIRQRRPFLVMDRITRWELEPQPTLWSAKYVSSNDPIFEGHFPTFPILPGAITLEGVAQTAGSLLTLTNLHQYYQEQGKTFAELIEQLKNAEKVATLQPGASQDSYQKLAEQLKASAGEKIGVAGAVNIRFKRPVFPGCLLEMKTTLAHRHGAVVKFKVQATVENEEVVRGTITGSAIIPGAA